MTTCTIRTLACAIAAALCLPLTGCGGGTADDAADSPSARAGAVRSDTPITDQQPLPDLVGKGLGAARDSARAAGFYGLTPHDALGRDRAQTVDRDWTVCFQTPEPGRHPTDTRVELGAVRTDETCPRRDSEAPEKAVRRLPAFVGMSVRAVRKTLDPSTVLDVEDTTGQGRFILVEADWEVCDQTPQAGTAVTGQRVTLQVVKFGEDCPGVLSR